MSTPWLTIATVVKDDPAGLSRTVRSLAGQELADVEFIIVDSSADRSDVDSVLRDPALGAVRALTTYGWEPARGIYPAMNSALQQAHGDHTLFLNAGDELASSGVLASVRAALQGRPRAWAFGPVEVQELSGRVVTTPSWDYAAEKRHAFARGHFPSHQGTFASTSLLRQQGGFDPTYAIAADYAAFLNLAKSSDPIVLDLVVARFFEGGASTQNWVQSFAEFHRARRTILRPRGTAGVVEYADTAWHFARVAFYRGVVRPWRDR